MIRVTIDLVPFGDESQKRMLETFTIANTGEHTHLKDQYVYKAEYKGKTVELYHLRSMHVFGLVREAIDRIKTRIGVNHNWQAEEQEKLTAEFEARKKTYIETGEW